MASSNNSDPLFEIRNAFFIGNFQYCINEAQKSKFNDPAHQLEKDIYMYRSYIAQRKFGVVKYEIKSSSPAELQCILMLATYMSGTENEMNEVVAVVKKQIASLHPDNKVLPLIAGLIFYLEQDYDAVLRLLHKSDHMESCALAIQTFLAINRVDLAQKELNTMKEMDEDGTLTQLAQAWVNLARNAEKIQEAYYIFQELSDKYTSTPMLLNGQSAALIALGKYEEAKPLLQEALDKDPNCPETLINMVLLSQHLGKNTEVSIRYLNQLKDSHANHPFIRDFKSKEQEFDRLSKMYAPVPV